MPQRRASGSPELREALADGDRFRIEVERGWCDIAGLLDTERIVGWQRRIADLAAGRPVEVDTSALWLALAALGDDRRYLVEGPRVGKAHEGRRWTVDADGSFALVADAEA